MDVAPSSCENAQQTSVRGSSENFHEYLSSWRDAYSRTVDSHRYPSPWSTVKDPPGSTSPVTTSPSQRPRFEGAVTCSQTVAREASTDQARRTWESAISYEKKGTAALYAPLSASAENDDPPPGPSRRYRVAQNATAAAAATF